MRRTLLAVVFTALPGILLAQTPEHGEGDALFYEKRQGMASLAVSLPDGQADVLVIASGFPREMETEFYRVVREVGNELSSIAPFNKFPGLVQLHPYVTQLNLGCEAEDALGITSLWPCSQVEVFRAAMESGISFDKMHVIHYDEWLKLLSSKGYGYRDLGTFEPTHGVSSFAWDVVDVTVHEIGHVLLDLADEYPYDRESWVAPSANCVPAEGRKSGYEWLAGGCSGDRTYFRPPASRMYSSYIRTFNPISEEQGEIRLRYYAQKAVGAVEAPKNFVPSVNGSTVSLRWDPVPGASGYELSVGWNGAGSVDMIIPVVGSGLAADAPTGTYWVRVHATGGDWTPEMVVNVR